MKEGDKIEKICGYCGKTYTVLKSQEGRTKYCSDKCFRASRNTREEYKCDCCGATFLVPRRKIEDRINGKRKHILCSSECAKNIQKPNISDVISAFENRGYILTSDTYISAKQKLTYICPKHMEHGEQSITYNNLIAGFGCKYCGAERTAGSRRLSFDEVKNIFLEHDMLLCKQEYVNASTPLAYICKNHPSKGIQYKTLSNAYKQGCPYCSQSRGERYILQYLIQHEIVFVAQKKFDSLIGVGGKQLSYDYYIPSKNTLIEYQGEYHDGTARIQDNDELIKQQEHDKRKRDYANANHIKLLEIWYYDYNNIDNILNELLRT
jgi:hypothetical protein